MSTFSVIHYVMIAAVLFISSIIYKLIIRPYLALRFYKQQGAYIYFKPGLGILQKNEESANKHGDTFYWYKQIVNKHPDLKIIAGNVGPEAVVVLLDPQLIKDFSQKQDQELTKWIVNFAAIQDLVGSGMFFATGKTWKKHRKLVSQVFHYEFLKEVLPVISNTAEKAFERLRESNNLQSVWVMEEMQKVTGEIVGKIFFGEDFAEVKMNGKPLTAMVSEIMTEAGIIRKEFWILFFGVRFVKAGILKRHRDFNNKKKIFRDICREFIEKEKANIDKSGSLLRLLLEQQKQDKDEALSDDEIIDEFITFCVAGTETTAHLLSMVIYALCQNPKVLQRVQEEVDKYIPKEINKVTLDELNKLDYTMAVLKETLRMWTPAPMLLSRITMKDHMLGDVKIKKGTLITPGMILNNFNPNYFKDANTFSPERWFDKEQEEIVKEPFLFMPFSAGGRNCIGQHFALIEARIILASFIRKFKFESEKDFDLKMSCKFIYEPMKPFKVCLNPK